MVNNLTIDSSPYDCWLEYDSVKIGYRVLDENGIKAWRQGFAPAIAPQVRESTYSYQHQPPEIDIAVPFEDWRSGGGFTDAISERSQRGYNYARGIDLSWPHRAYVSPARRNALIGAAEIAAAPVKFWDGTDGFFVIAGQYVYEWTVSSQDWTVRNDATADATNFTDFVEMDGTNYVGRGDSQDYKYSTDGITWTAFTDADRNFKFFTVRGQSSGEAVLWGTSDSGQLRNTTNGINGGVAWSASVLAGAGHSSETAQAMIEADDKVYVFKREGIFRYDGTTMEDVWLGGRRMNRTGNGKNPLLWGNQKIYVPYGDRLMEFDPNANNGAGLMRTVWPFEEAVGNSELNGAVTAIAGDGDWIYFALKNAAGNTYMMKGRPEEGFHSFAYLGANDCDAMIIAAPGSVHANNPALMFGYGVGARYFILPRSGLRPEDDTNCRYDTAEGVTYGAWEEVGTKAYKKFLNGGRAMAQNATAGMPVTFAYEVDDGSETTLLTAKQSGQTSAILSTIVEFNRIRRVLRMSTPSANQAPRLLGLVFNVTPNTPRKKMWTADLLIGDHMAQVGGGVSRIGARQALQHLERSLAKRVTLYDRRSRTFTVRVLDVDGLGTKTTTFGDVDIMRVTLVEIAETTETSNTFTLNEDALNGPKVLA